MDAAKWYGIASDYDLDSGMLLNIHGRSLRLEPDDVDYLLLAVDWHVIADKNNPPSEVGFMLLGKHVVLTIEEWRDFHSALFKAAKAGGWAV